MSDSFSRRRALGVVGGSLALPFLGSRAFAQAADWPQKPVRIVVPFAAGSATDAVVRVIAPHLTRLWGQGIIIDNRPGGSGVAATEAVVRAEPDGYTLGLGCLPVNVTNPILKADLGYDVDADTVPIVLIGTNRMYLVTHVSVPALDLRQFIEFARQNPGKLSYGSGGNATPQHLAMELLKIREKLDILMVPYPRGNMMTDLLTGRIHTAMYVGPMGVVRKDTLRVLGVAATERFHGEPDIPSFAEQGVPNFESDGFFSFYGPKGLSPAVVKRINLDANQALKDPELAQRLLEMQIVVRGGTPEELAQHIKRQQTTVRGIIEAAGIR